MKKLTQEQFIVKCKEVHGDLYYLDNVVYKNSTTKILVTCKIHGEWETNPRNFIKGCGCPKCKGKNLSLEEWVERFKVKHGDRYDYSKFIYIGVYDKSTIICSNHGEFQQNAHNHSNGQKCPICSREESYVNNTYYNKTLAERFKESWSKIPCKLYIVKMYDDNETFFKVGITNQDITRRFRAYDTPYNIEVLQQIQTNRYEAVIEEDRIIKINAENKYKPLNNFKGYTECFTKIKGIDYEKTN